MYLLGHAKTGPSASALMRHSGMSYRKAWMAHRKVIGVMAAADAQVPQGGSATVEDGYLGSEPPRTVGRGLPDKVTLVVAVQLIAHELPTHAEPAQVPSFTSRAIAARARPKLLPVTNVLNDGPGCFAAVNDAGCAHTINVVRQRKPRELPRFKWVERLLGNPKTAINGAQKHFAFGKSACSFPGAFAYRFDH